jgi:hypothetical protein
MTVGASKQNFSQPAAGEHSPATLSDPEPLVLKNRCFQAIVGAGRYLHVLPAARGAAKKQVAC